MTWQPGTAAGCAACAAAPSPNCGPRPAGTPVDLVADPFDQPAARRLRRRRDRAPLHEPPRLGRPSLLRGRSAASRSRRTSWCAATASWSSSCRATSAPGTPARRRGADAPSCNDFSIGIELEGLEGSAFEPAQYERLGGAAARRSRARYPIDAVAGHEHVAPGRKGDPGAGFDWARLAAPDRLAGAAGSPMR